MRDCIEFDAPTRAMDILGFTACRSFVAVVFGLAAVNRDSF